MTCLLVRIPQDDRTRARHLRYQRLLFMHTDGSLYIATSGACDSCLQPAYPVSHLLDRLYSNPTRTPPIQHIAPNTALSSTHIRTILTKHHGAPRLSPPNFGGCFSRSLLRRFAPPPFQTPAHIKTSWHVPLSLALRPLLAFIPLHMPSS